MALLERCYGHPGLASSAGTTWWWS